MAGYLKGDSFLARAEMDRMSYADFKSCWTPYPKIAADLKNDINKKGSNIYSLVGALKKKYKKSYEGINIYDVNQNAFLEKYRQDILARMHEIGKTLKNAKDNWDTEEPNFKGLEKAIEDFQKALASLGLDLSDGKAGKASAAVEAALGRMKVAADKSNASDVRKTAFEESLSLYGSIYRPLITLIGDIGEQFVRDSGSTKNGTPGPLMDKIKKAGLPVVANAMKPQNRLAKQGGSVRSSVKIDIPDGNKSATFKKRYGSPLVDAYFELKDENGKVVGYFKFSVKTSAALTADKMKSPEITALTRPLGAYMKVIAEDDNLPESNSHWWRFVRLLGQTAGKEAREAKTYIGAKNMSQALFGFGEDAIGDFVINGKLYSKKYIYQKIASQINHEANIARVLKMTGSLTSETLEDNKEYQSKADQAINTFLHPDKCLSTLGKTLQMHVTIPDLIK